MEITTVDNIIQVVREHGTTPIEEDILLLKRAEKFAHAAHDGQMRKDGTTPYVHHVMEAGMNCARYGMPPTVIAAAILHDTVEDTPVTKQELEDEFGAEISELVESVTKLGKLKYQGRARHVESLRKFFMAVAKDPRVVVIKLADRIHNLQTLAHVRKDKQERIALESIEIYAPLAFRMGMAKMSNEIQDTAFPYAYPKEYEMVQQVLKRRRKTDLKYLNKVYRSLKKEMALAGINDVSTQYRIKGMKNKYKKLKIKEMNIDRVHDIVALRVIVASIEDCYRVLGLIHTMWRPLPGRIKDYIASPKPNGYQSLHTTIFTGDGGKVEVQIRTPEMHEVAEYGIASHYSYKQLQESRNNSVSKAYFPWIQQLSEMNQAEQDQNQYLKNLKDDFFQDRIFVFTPDGDVIDLPSGSSVIDFAYAIHSDLGNHLSSALVNDKNVSIKTILETNDIVEVINKDKSRPSSKWLPFAKTSMATKHIKSYLRKNQTGLLDKLLKRNNS